MSSSRQETEEMEESLLPTEHEGSFEASTSRQQVDSQRQMSTSSTRTDEDEHQEEETLNGEHATRQILRLPVKKVTVACCHR